MKQLLRLSLMLLALLLPATASAYDFEVDGIYYDINGNNATVTDADAYYETPDYSGDVTIPETVTYNGTTYSVTSIGSEAFYNCSGLTSIDIPNSVTSIGYDAFSGCSGLTRVNITDLTSWLNIYFNHYCYYSESNPLSYAHHLFLNGMEIEDLIIPDSVTVISGGAFSGCYGLKSVTIPNSVTSISPEAFSNCI